MADRVWHMLECHLTHVWCHDMSHTSGVISQKSGVKSGVIAHKSGVIAHTSGLILCATIDIPNEQVNVHYTCYMLRISPAS